MPKGEKRVPYRGSDGQKKDPTVLRSRRSRSDCRVERSRSSSAGDNRRRFIGPLAARGKGERALSALVPVAWETRSGLGQKKEKPGPPHARLLIQQDRIGQSLLVNRGGGSMENTVTLPREKKPHKGRETENKNRVAKLTFPSALHRRKNNNALFRRKGRTRRSWRGRKKTDTRKKKTNSIFRRGTANAYSEQGREEKEKGSSAIKKNEEEEGFYLTFQAIIAKRKKLQNPGNKKTDLSLLT